MPGTNLTRIEAAERAALIAAESYDVALDLTGSPERFASRTTVRFACRRPGASSFIDLIAPSVSRIVLNGRQLDPAAVFYDSRIALDDLAADNTLVVEADCAYSNTGEGLHRFVDPVDGEVYLYSQFEVADARRVFAVFEQPDLKATFTLEVTAPAGWTVISNTPLETQSAADVDPGQADAAVLNRFQTTPRLSPYLVAIVAGPYAQWQDQLTSADGRTIPLGVYCRRSLAEYLDADNIFDTTKRGFAFYEPTFDFPYPYAKYDQIFVPEFNAGAMENVGAVTITETYIFRSAVTQARVERRAITVLHELAHMWFGDLVTMRWWDDLWLNESFAEFVSHLAAVEATEWTDAWTTFAAAEKSWAYRQDQLPSTHPIMADIRDLEDVEVNFDGITYAKGASVLRQLVAWVGQEAFFRGIAAYFAKYAWSNTTLADLMAELETASGRDLSQWTELWLTSAGVTTLCPKVRADDDGRIASVQIVQKPSPATDVAYRPHRLAVAGYALADKVLRRTWRYELDVDGEVTEVPDAAGRRIPDLLLVNDGDLAYAKIRFDPASLVTAKAQVGRIDDPLARAVVWAGLWDATRDAELPAWDYAGVILNNIKAESSSTVVQTLLGQLATCLAYYVAPEDRDELTIKAAARLGTLLANAEPGSDTQLQFLKAFAVHARTGDQIDRIAALVDGGIELPGLAIDTDLRWELLEALAAAGRIGQAEISAASTLDPTATGARAAARVQAALPNHEAKAAAFQSATWDLAVPNAVQAAVIGGFQRVHDRGLLTPFVEPYFAMLEEVWAKRTSESASRIVEGLYPALTLNDPEARLLERTDQWLQALGERTPALRRLVIEAQAGVARSLRAQERDRLG